VTVGLAIARASCEGRTSVRAEGDEVRRGLLYVAGGPTGTITVYDLATQQPVATFQTGTGGFLNDLVVTSTGSWRRAAVG
jgi:hypothetical protein